MRRERRIAVSVLIIILIVLWVRILLGEYHSQPIMSRMETPYYVVYYASRFDTLLVPEFHEGEGSVSQLLVDLIEEPRLPELISPLPPGVEVLGFEQQGDVLYVNFSHHLVTEHPGGSSGEMITVYSIVNTLVGAPGVERVQILVEGHLLETLVGHLYIGEPLQKDHFIMGSLLI
ncbi:MAG: GerMN domain-containing protein [Firmicutes bacterium]|nr:GerMN domain-containing protein [Bacillota bacterium]